MTTADGRGKSRRDTLLPIILCLCFIGSSIIFLVQMILKSQKENVAYLYDAANQTRTSILKQIEGDWQTLEGLAVSLRELVILDENQILTILNDINEENAFIRMGYADINGNARMVDMEGNVEEVNLKGMDFFERALQGEKSISNTFADQQDASGYINYFGVRINDGNGNARGVLCAVHSAVVLREIIDAPVLKGAGYSNILDANGNYVLKTIKTFEGDILPDNKEKIAEVIRDTGRGDFILTDRQGVRQMLVILPIIEGQWYQASMVPVDVLRSSYIQTAWGIMIIIVVACSLFIWLMSRQRKMAVNNQKMLMELAYSDSLTGLRNFAGFKREVEIFLNRPEISRSELTSYVLWYGDLRNFKLINDVLGYEEGDRLLRLVAEFLRTVEGPDCICCRIAADNFAGITRCEDTQVLDSGLCQLKEYMRNSGMDEQPFMEIPVGVYRFRAGDGKQSLDVLVNYANMAHKIAKERPGSSYVFYDDSIRRRMLEDTALESEAEAAMEDDEFKLYMQPKIDIQNGNQITGAEVLARWLSPSRGLILPGNFIPLFEKSELIVKLDRYMFEHACRWYRSHLEQGGRPVSLAVNVSKAGLFQNDFVDYYTDFVDYYTDIKDKYSIPDRVMELEFTESILAADTELFAELVVNLNARGFICSLDDFGSGYSSLNLLKNLPIDVLKLDILFFQKSRDIRRERIVVSNVINMAKELDIKTIAEGVEDMDTVEFLRKAGCNVIQGYVFAKPMPQEDFEHLLTDNQDGSFGGC